MIKKEHPLITFFVFAYNQEDYIEEACRAALKQDYSPLEIIFSDDCSNDRTYDIMKAVAESYEGHHSIKLNRNVKNLGLIDHVNLSFRISSGDLIVAAAGDDVSLTHRVSRIAETYLASGKSALVIHSNVRKIDENGCDCGEWIPPVITQKMDFEDIANSTGLYIGATGAWSKKIFEYFGPLHYKNAYEDLTLGFRASLLDRFLYINESLVNYRIGIGISSEYSFARDLNAFRQRKRDVKRIKKSLIYRNENKVLLKKRCSWFWTKRFLKLNFKIANKISNKIIAGMQNRDDKI